MLNELDRARDWCVAALLLTSPFPWFEGDSFHLPSYLFI